MTLKNKHEKFIILNFVLNFLTPAFEFLNDDRPSRQSLPSAELINNIKNLKLSSLKVFLHKGNFLFLWENFYLFGDDIS
jgi:hypothetical protein